MTFALKTPWTASPLVVIDLTLPACTSEMKYGQNGIVTRGCDEVWLKSTESELTASSADHEPEEARACDAAGALGGRRAATVGRGRDLPAALVARHRRPAA